MYLLRAATSRLMHSATKKSFHRRRDCFYGVAVSKGVSVTVGRMGVCVSVAVAVAVGVGGIGVSVLTGVEVGGSGVKVLVEVAVGGTGV